MGSVEEHLGGNATLITSLRYQLRDLWRSPRGMVLRIEALALVAITLSFFLAFFGSCRRWSNRWIVQNGFLAAQVLSLSLGTYSIGLMQSSPVKSEMYPIWAVSLLTLFGCVDPVTTYIGLDYKGPLSKMIFQLCLYFGYVMLMSVSTISSNVGRLAIILLSTITFIKGFDRAMAFALPGEIQGDIAMGWIRATEPTALAGDGGRLKVQLPLSLGGILETISDSDLVTMAHIQELSLPEGTIANGMTIKDVCLSYSFSHLLRQRFLGLDTAREMEEKLKAFERLVRDGTTIDYMRALKVVEVELAFLFEAFFTSNEFLHFYQAKAGTFWALASFVGICFVGVVAAIIPGALASRHNIINSAAASGGPGAGTSTAVNIVGTTAADLIITLVILASLALLQLVQLLRCWTSNWARVRIACKYAIKAKKQMPWDEGRSVVVVTVGDEPNDDPQRRYEEELCSSSNTIRSINQIINQWEMGLRLFLVARVKWFEKYLWQAKLGQDSLAALLQRRRTQRGRESVLEKACCCCGHCPLICRRMLFGVGVHHFCRVVGALLLSDTTNPGGVVKLHDDVKASIAEFLGTIKSRRIGVEWSALFLENGLQDWLEYLPYTNTSVPVRHYGDESEAYAFTRRVMIWHIATWYCEEAEKAAGGNRGAGEEDDSGSSSREKNRRVAMDLSKYCAYLVVSAPELLPERAAETKKALDRALRKTEYALRGESNTITILEAEMPLVVSSDNPGDRAERIIASEFVMTGVYLGKRLRNEATTTPLTPLEGRRPGGRNEQEGEQSTRRPCSTDHWELLARLWVQTLLYAAPYGDVQAHMQRLAQGGEFITHLWALLFHLGIDKWEVADIDELKAGAAETTTTREVLAKEDAVIVGLEIEENN